MFSNHHYKRNVLRSSLHNYHIDDKYDHHWAAMKDPLGIQSYTKVFSNHRTTVLSTYSLYFLLKIFYCIRIVRWDWLAKNLVFVWGPQKSINHSIHFYFSNEFSTFIKMARHTVSAPKTPITEFLVSPHDGKNMPILSTVRVPYSDNNCWVFSKKNKTRLKIRPKKEEICNWAITRPDRLE